MMRMVPPLMHATGKASRKASALPERRFFVFPRQAGATVRALFAVCVFLNTFSAFRVVCDASVPVVRFEQATQSVSPVLGLGAAGLLPEAGLGTLLTGKDPLASAFNRVPAQERERDGQPLFLFSWSGASLTAARNLAIVPFAALISGGLLPAVTLSSAQPPGPPGGGSTVFLCMLLFLIVLSRSNLPWEILVVRRSVE